MHSFFGSANGLKGRIHACLSGMLRDIESLDKRYGVHIGRDMGERIIEGESACDFVYGPWLARKA
ncbi:MAG: hypothetical protein FWG30_07025 [Eubacteriaceae bacterium]|nr:hypothetical protein [Eubacteriaceae bacterium]